MVVACVAHGEGGRRSGSRRAGEDQRSQRADVRVAEVASKQSAVVAREPARAEKPDADVGEDAGAAAEEGQRE